MSYCIEAKQNLQELIDVLNEQEIEVKLIEESLIEVQVEEGESYERFLHFLSLFIAHYSFKDMLTESLLKLNVSKKDVKKIVGNQLKEQKNSNYFNFITKILLREYFKNLKTLKISSFQRFNMKGFKEEIKLFAKNLVGLQENYEEEIVGEEIQMGSQDVFDSIRDNAVMGGLDLDEFNELHARMENERVHFTNSKGVKLDQEFFLEILGGSLQFYLEDNVEDPALVEDMLTLSVLLKVFDVKKIVMHKSLTAKVKDLIAYNVSLVTEKVDRKIEVVECHGCNQC